MKSYFLLINCMISLLIFSANSSLAEEEKRLTEVVDQVYEWVPNGTTIQVGDYTISDFGTVWLDNGIGEVTQTNSSKITTGDLVKAYLIDRDENGFWIADKIVVFAGSAFTSAVEELPEIKRNKILNSEEPSDDNAPTTPQTKEPTLENGVWVN